MRIVIQKTTSVISAILFLPFAGCPAAKLLFALQDQNRFPTVPGGARFVFLSELSLTQFGENANSD
jgi:hypothetical protein